MATTTTTFEPFFSIYTDAPAASSRGDGVGSGIGASLLPGGCCNYVDLSPGASAARCGCRRFWSRAPAGCGGADSPFSSPTVWCMCGHHACYHDEGGGRQMTVPARMPTHQPTLTIESDCQLLVPYNNPGQENERPRNNREPLSPVVQEPAGSHYSPSGVQVSVAPPSIAPMPISMPSIESVASFSTSRMEDFELQLGQLTDSRAEPSLPDTLGWDTGGMPSTATATPVPMQAPPAPAPASASAPASAAATSQPQMHSPWAVSSTNSSQARYLRPFGGRGLNTLSGGGGGGDKGAKPRSTLRGIPDDNNDPERPGLGYRYRSPGDIIDSFEAARGQEKRSPSPDGGGDISPPGRESRDGGGGGGSGGDGGDGGDGGEGSREELRALSNVVQGHEQRLDRLETVSFSTSHEECNDKHDQVDLRVTDLEARMDEVEKCVNEVNNNTNTGDNNNSNSNNNNHMTHNKTNNGPHPDTSLSSSARSVISSVSAGGGDPGQQLHVQLQALQSRIDQLQSAIPSYSFAWEIEVVFLPFPLRRVWQGRDSFKADAAGCDNDEWTQMPNSASACPLPPTTGPRSQSPFCGGWGKGEATAGAGAGGGGGDGDGHEWLLPKACGPQSITDRRLRSRGLVRMISVKGPDARSVQAAINSVFGDVLRPMPSPSSASPTQRPRPADGRVARFLGLQQAWVPLRKIHKDSRLRFLAPAEMVTPTLWDVPFLNSVIMRSSEPRLFVTHPDAYLQDRAAYEGGWSWQRVREMSRVYQQQQQEVPEADAMEECWTFNEQLDEPPLPPPPPPPPRFSRSYSSRRAAPTTSLPAATAAARRRTQSAREQGPSSPVIAAPPSSGKERVGAGLYVRTTSVPPATMTTTQPPQFSPAMNNKRRVSSNSGERRPSPIIRTVTASAIQKRRRTRSPSNRPWYTPRWTASPSPAPHMAHNPPGADERPPVQRGVTPLYYATPHSNAGAPPPQPAEARSSNRRTADPDDDDDGGDAAIFEGADADKTDMDVDVDVYDDGDEDDESDPYEDEDEDDEDDDDSVISVRRIRVPPPPPNNHHDNRHHPHQNHDSQLWQLPEDEPWPGIEDQMSDVENVDPTMHEGEQQQHGRDRDGTNDSSQPSEYPSTQHAWIGDVGGARERDAGEFHIHEDEDGDFIE